MSPTYRGVRNLPTRTPCRAPSRRLAATPLALSLLLASPGVVLAGAPRPPGPPGIGRAHGGAAGVSLGRIRIDPHRKTTGASRDTADAASDTVHLPEIVVTAYRMATPRSAVVSDLTVLDSAEIRRSGTTHVLDLLRRVPGAAVVQTGSWGAPASLFLRGGESNYVKVLVDGVPVNDAGGDFDFSTLTTDGIERIEVLRGPASVLYGSDAMTGVIQIFTRRGDGPPRVSAGVRGGSFGSLDASVRMGGGTSAVGYGGSVDRFTTDGTLPFNDAYGNTTATGSVRLEPDARTRATVTARYTDFTAHFPTDGSGRLVDHNQFRDGRSLVLGLQAERRLGDRVTVHLQAGTHEARSALRDPPDGPADTTGFYAGRSGGDQSRRDVDVRLDFRPVPEATLTVGGSWEHEAGTDSTVSFSSFGPYRSRTSATRHDVSGYLQLLEHPSPAWTLTAGARLDDDAAFGTYATWRAGAAWRLPTGTRLRAAAGTGFKEPSFFEQVGGGGVVGNPALSPEHSRSWEVGASQILAGGLVELRATWFDQRFDNLIQYDPSSLPPAPAYFNVPSAAARGVETSLELRPSRAFSVGASWSWVHTEALDTGFDAGPDATFVRGSPLLRRPVHSGELTLDWAPTDRGSLELAITAVGPRWDRDFSSFPATRVRLPGYVRADLSGSWTVLREGRGRPGVDATLSIDNLTDHSYLDVVGFPARGRTILVGARGRLPF